MAQDLGLRLLLEVLDHDYLQDPALDGFEDDPTFGPPGMASMRVQDWFAHIPGRDPLPPCLIGFDENPLVGASPHIRVRHVSAGRVRKWRDRVAEQCMEGLRGPPGSGRPLLAQSHLGRHLPCRSASSLTVIGGEVGHTSSTLWLVALEPSGVLPGPEPVRSCRPARILGCGNIIWKPTSPLRQQPLPD